MPLMFFELLSVVLQENYSFRNYLVKKIEEKTLDHIIGRENPKLQPFLKKACSLLPLERLNYLYEPISHHTSLSIFFWI